MTAPTASEKPKIALDPRRPKPSGFWGAGKLPLA